MKKILSLLTVLTLTTGATTSVVSCNNKTTKKTTKFDVFNLNTWGDTQKKAISDAFKNYITNIFFNKSREYTWLYFKNNYSPNLYEDADQAISKVRDYRDFSYKCFYSDKNEKDIDSSKLVKNIIKDGIWMTIKIDTQNEKFFTGECWVWIQGSV